MVFFQRSQDVPCLDEASDLGAVRVAAYGALVGLILFALAPVPGAAESAGAAAAVLGMPGSFQ